MSSAARLLLFVVLPGAASAWLRAEVPSNALPPGYHLREEDISPDKRFGVIHADANVIDDAKARNFLVALNPFRILSENQGPAFSEGGGARAMVVEWNQDTSAALVFVGGKWGTIGATLFELKEGRVTRRTDLLGAVTRALAGKFPSSKVGHYNDGAPFVIDGTDAWEFSEDGKQVSVDVSVDTAPNLAPGPAWRGKLKGIWSVPKARWVEQKTAGKIHRNPK